MVDYEVFLGRYYPQASEQREKDVQRFVSHVNDIVEQSSVEQLTSKQTLCNLFFFQATGGVSRSHYQKIKEYLLNLFDYFKLNAEVPSREEVIESQPVVSFFKNFDDMIEFIDYVGESKLAGYNKRIDLMNVKVLAALGWYGLSTAQIANLTKRCTYRDGATFVVKADDQTFVIDDLTSEMIDTLSHIDTYHGLPSGKTQNYKGDDTMLFRPTTANCERVTSDTLIQILKRFNAAIPAGQDRAINFRRLRKNAQFVMIYNDKTDRKLVDKIMDYMNCDHRLAYGYKKEYRHWVELFYDENIE